VADKRLGIGAIGLVDESTGHWSHWPGRLVNLKVQGVQVQLAHEEMQVNKTENQRLQGQEIHYLETGPTTGPSEVIPVSLLEPMCRSWSHFVGIHYQKLTRSLGN